MKLTNHIIGFRSVEKNRSLSENYHHTVLLHTMMRKLISVRILHASIQECIRKTLSLRSWIYLENSDGNWNCPTDVCVVFHMPVEDDFFAGFLITIDFTHHHLTLRSLVRQYLLFIEYAEISLVYICPIHKHQAYATNITLAENVFPCCSSRFLVRTYFRSCTARVALPGEYFMVLATSGGLPAVDAQGERSTNWFGELANWIVVIWMSKYTKYSDF